MSERKIDSLKTNGLLCIASKGRGTVAVFENIDALEGCTRIATPGTLETLISYVSFDNCAWKQLGN